MRAYALRRNGTIAYNPLKRPMTIRGSGETRPAFMWTLPVCPHQVAVEFEVIRTLQHAVTAAPEPQQGLLYGRKRSGVTCVQAVQPLPTLDPRTFKASLNQARWPVVGFYRIRDGCAFVFEPGEVDLAKDLFHEAGSIVLLIERREAGPAEGAFAFWRGETFVSNLPHLFPIDAAALAGEQLVFSEPLPPAGRGEGVFHRPASQIGALAVAALVLLTLQFAWRRTPQPSPHPAVAGSISPAVANAARPRTDLEITWRLDSLANATTGLLKIRDGAVQHQVPLDGGHLQEGHLIYSSGSGAVSVEMAALRSDGRIVAVPVSARLLSEPLLPVAPVLQQTSAFSPGVRDPELTDMRQPPRPGAASAPERASRRTFELPAVPERSAPHPPQLPDPPAVQLLAAVIPQTGLPLPAAPLPAPPLTPVVQAAERVVPSPAEVVKHVSGRLIWTGTLLSHGVVEFDGQSVSVGSVSGALPGLPINFTISPAEFRQDGLVVYTADPARSNQVELPSARNGWNRIKFIWNPERVHEITILESPNASNRFSHLALRADTRRCSMLLIDWKDR